ncbi:MAG TPA: hypothetical protein VMG40_18185 [Bryobacteraceae bacterium]|nr:hypothetical protein [Bryobacteraceae bacterium]
MASRKNPENKPEPAQEPIIEAAEKATLVIRGLQSRLRGQPSEPAAESSDDLERQLQQYFATSLAPSQRAPLLNDLRNRIIDRVADRILAHWEQNNALENEVIERLINRVLERLGASVQ